MRNRRSFLVAGSTLLLSPYVISKSRPNSIGQEEAGVQNLPIHQVQAFVSTAHTNLERTQLLLKDEPKLIRANYEWAPGDFESAVDGAAHSGSIEIVKYLLSEGATYSIFVAAVLGHLDTVQASVAHNPQLIHCRGPHGINLLQHALAGGEAAKKVAEFLTEQGATPDEDWIDLEFDESLADFAVGRYKIERGGRAIEISIAKEDGKLFIIAGERPKKRLLYQGQNRFAVKDTPAELVFEKNDGKKCQRILLKEQFPIGFANRIE